MPISSCDVFTSCSTHLSQASSYITTNATGRSSQPTSFISTHSRSDTKQAAIITGILAIACLLIGMIAYVIRYYRPRGCKQRSLLSAIPALHHTRHSISSPYSRSFHSSSSALVTTQPITYSLSSTQETSQRTTTYFSFPHPPAYLPVSGTSSETEEISPPPIHRIIETQPHFETVVHPGKRLSMGTTKILITSILFPSHRTEGCVGVVEPLAICDSAVARENLFCPPLPRRSSKRV